MGRLRNTKKEDQWSPGLKKKSRAHLHESSCQFVFSRLWVAGSLLGYNSRTDLHFPPMFRQARGLTATQPPVFPPSYTGRRDEASQTAYGSTPVTAWPEESRRARISVNTSSSLTVMNAAVKLRPFQNNALNLRLLLGTNPSSWVLIFQMYLHLLEKKLKMNRKWCQWIEDIKRLNEGHRPEWQAALSLDCILLTSRSSIILLNNSYFILVFFLTPSHFFTRASLFIVTNWTQTKTALGPSLSHHWFRRGAEGVLETSVEDVQTGTCHRIINYSSSTILKERC